MAKVQAKYLSKGDQVQDGALTYTVKGKENGSVILTTASRPKEKWECPENNLVTKIN